MQLIEPGKEFGPFKRLFWPVHRHELAKLLPMLVIAFLITFNYNILRTLKDALILTAKSSGAEVIPFLKVWVMFPLSIILTLIYTRLVRRFRREHVFYIMMGGFLGYFLLFACVLYPNQSYFQLDAPANWLQNNLSAGFYGLISLVRYWSFALFYAMSELWGAIILFTCFWGFANENVKVDEAKRFYGLFGIGINLSGFAVGVVAQALIIWAPYLPLPFDVDVQNRIPLCILSLVICSGLISIILFRWLHMSVFPKERVSKGEQNGTNKGERVHLGLRESLRTIVRSPYLLSIAAIVLSYNLVINLLEVLWKSKVHELYPTMEGYSQYMYEVTTLIGITATLISLFVSGNSLRKLGWTFTAFLTPVMILITSCGLFFFLFCQNFGALGVFTVLKSYSLQWVVFFGSAQNVLSRACKYTVFDVTKELAFVPLPTEHKLKGKAAIDGVGSRLGKSMGSAAYQCLLIGCGSLSACTPYIAILVLGSVLVWLVSVYLLGEQFSRRSDTAPALSSEGVLEEGVATS